MPKVAIVKNVSDPVETTVKALGLIESDVLTALSGGKPILIKPNYLNAKHPSTGPRRLAPWACRRVRFHVC